jgi:hypothetical protein
MALKAKDQGLPRITVDSPATEVMVYIHLSTPEHPFVAAGAGAPHVSTALGDICFRLSEGGTVDD